LTPAPFDSSRRRVAGLRHARESDPRDLSQRDLATLVGVSQPVIVEWETGRGQGPNERQVAALAAALGCTVEKLSAPQVGAAPRRDALTAVLDGLPLPGLEVEAMRMLRLKPRESPRLSPLPLRRARRAAEAARELRRAAAIRDDLVDIDDVLARCRMAWDYVNVGRGVAALGIATERGAVVGVSAAIRGAEAEAGWDRDASEDGELAPAVRYQLAVQLGHYVLGDMDPVVIDFAVSEVGPPRGRLRWRSGHGAHVFAQKLLMPNDRVRAAARDCASVLEIAERFGVEPLTAAFRLGELDEWREHFRLDYF
jgi:transcriptional regulator with XRE-family HTH domain